ncbi:hypothetical protein A3H26_01520 [candidate division WWE3 bacterium RIFCSPLOWO2_12_FULL_36_10]|uniref:Methylated-DNA-[protein]-cysteine S-methyltransferase DNA binding domain-containing protein n=1 Tax=candidate division WWE3 bacterium RIFCSPLOWO2_12_FULL_36_10 TaxID=1802630 RepID=A0A1F4VFM6_UNCKA|nr:MAG: hypothetical protein A3H26_01520 [candidate division WWE3 bacterium RIFCSPLOWO2_12_FULL_36_10]
MSKISDTVLNIVGSIPKGKVASYGQVALMAGFPRGARRVGWILHQLGDNSPWWRIINNSGRISTSCLEHTALLQKELLINEGVRVTNKLKIDIEKYRYRPNSN